ncbi:phage tail fiber C-terminal domain-containing protein [Escherichia coli]|uniref:phage tail fiber C-terminal domain-containing protein n=1 Tax=Escherichia coli TaxID=562 RepID=UPI0006B429BA|nr:phage tail fiber C-terminal domain-containing protein [Escherichia coli]
MIWQPEFTDKTLSRKPGAVQARVITQVVILDADKKQIQCVVRPLQILRADGTWENIGGMK